MQYSDLLKNYREQISTLDKEIIYLLFRRFTIVKQIGEIKKLENVEALQKDRWNELMNDNLEKALEYGVNKKLVEDIWELIHNESLKIES